MVGGGLALVVFALDGRLHALGRAHLPALAVAADLRLTSLLLAALLLTLSASRALLRWPSAPPRPRVLLTAGALWLAGCAASTLLLGWGRVALPRWQDKVAFGLSGLLVEELLTRGVVLGAALRLWPATPGARPGRAALLSALVFALLHHQHHGFRLDGAAWAQVAWTLPLGVLLGWLVEQTRSLWPAVGLHLLNNAIVLLA